jgi:transcription elongation factor Elf1
LIRAARDTARMTDSRRITCPHCGERFEAVVDASEGAADYVEDCPVCCRPIEISIQPHVDDDGFDLRTERG